MSDKLILAIDVGSQSLRVGLVNKKGELVALEKVKYDPPYISNHKGEAVQDSDYFFNCIKIGLKRLHKSHGHLFKDILGLTLDTVRDTSVILDENFKPLHPSILWLDQRLASGSMKHRPKIHKFLFSVLGMMPTMELNLKKSISLWYQENRPDIWDKMRHYGNISSYLTYQLTGEWKDSPGSIIGHYPLDFKKGEFYKNNAAIKNFYGIPLNVLPTLVPQGEILGRTTKELEQETGLPAGLPLYSCASDKACESLGVGALTKDIAAISYGTASTVEVTVPSYRESQPFLPAYPFAIKGYYNMDVQIYRGYWMINWFLQNFTTARTDEEKEAKLKELNQKITKIPAGSDGLILQPYWQPGLERPSAHGSIVGFSDLHTGSHFYKAIIEGIGFALREALEYFEKKNHKHVKEIRISGGGSQSDEICQITADLFGIPVVRVQTFETSLLGAGIAGFLAAKEFTSPEEAVQAMVHRKDIFNPNKEAHKLYNKIFENGYKEMYPRLSPIYKHFVEFVQDKKN